MYKLYTLYIFVLYYYYVDCTIILTKLIYIQYIVEDERALINKYWKEIRIKRHVQNMVLVHFCPPPVNFCPPPMNFCPPYKFLPPPILARQIRYIKIEMELGIFFFRYYNILLCGDHNYAKIK